LTVSPAFIVTSAGENPEALISITVSLAPDEGAGAGVGSGLGGGIIVEAA